MRRAVSLNLLGKRTLEPSELMAELVWSCVCIVAVAVAATAPAVSLVRSGRPSGVDTRWGCRPEVGSCLQDSFEM